MARLLSGWTHLQSNGTVTAWGDSPHGETTVPDELDSVISISAGYFHSAALRQNGTVITWGENNGKAPAGLDDAIAIAAGTKHTVALRENGTIVLWGSFTNAPPLQENVTAITAGNSYTVALTGPKISTGSRVPAIRKKPDTGISLLSHSALVIREYYGKECYLTDLRGRIIQKFSSSRVDISRLPVGLYLVMQKKKGYPTSVSTFLKP